MRADSISDCKKKDSSFYFFLPFTCFGFHLIKPWWENPCDHAGFPPQCQNWQICNLLTCSHAPLFFSIQRCSGNTEHAPWLLYLKTLANQRWNRQPRKVYVCPFSHLIDCETLFSVTAIKAVEKTHLQMLTSNPFVCSDTRHPLFFALSRRHCHFDSEYYLAVIQSRVQPLTGWHFDFFTSSLIRKKGYPFLLWRFKDVLVG